MILIDTNVVSEPWKPKPDRHVIAWLDAQVMETLYLSTVTIAELRYGIAALPRGKRRTVLDTRLERTLLPLFAPRILPFDLAATRTYAELMSSVRATGRPISTADGYIAAIAAAHGMSVASRDTAPFTAAGVDVIDPWASGPQATGRAPD
ncbi:MAG TPA: type II toxin-antitoxin system VapC family toxin [Rhodanobacteraceae bacterium]